MKYPFTILNPKSLIILIVSFFLQSCEEDELPEIKIDYSWENPISSAETTLQLEITSGLPWQVTDIPAWIHPDKTESTEATHENPITETISITIEANIGESRSHELSIFGGNSVFKVYIEQKAGTPFEISGEQYKSAQLTVFFVPEENLIEQTTISLDENGLGVIDPVDVGGERVISYLQFDNKNKITIGRRVGEAFKLSFDETGKLMERIDEEGNVLINTVAELDDIRNKPNRGITYLQESDLDLSMFENWSSIHGDWQENSSFTGTYDGGNYKIHNLQVNDVHSSGLFHRISSACLQNIHIESGNIFSTSTLGLAAIVGSAEGEENVIRNCSNKATVTNSGYAGGIIGSCQHGSVIIYDCTNMGHIQGRIAGGIGGELLHATIINSLNTGEITPCPKYNDEVFVIGGIAGRIISYAIDKTSLNGCVNESNITFSSELAGLIGNIGGICGSSSYLTINCINKGDIIIDSEKGKYDIGGISASHMANIENCHNSGDITAKAQTIGGIVGRSSYKIIGCSNTGNISGAELCGGITGNIMVGDITRCFNTGNISGETKIGGIIGLGSSVINLWECYNTGNITSTGIYCGGIVGYTDTIPAGSRMHGCYNTGAITSQGDYCGGLAGEWRGRELSGNYNIGKISGKGIHVGSLFGYLSIHVNWWSSYSYINMYWTEESHSKAVGKFDVDYTAFLFSESQWPARDQEGWNDSAIWSDLGGYTAGPNGAPAYPKLGWE